MKHLGLPEDLGLPFALLLAVLMVALFWWVTESPRKPPAGPVWTYVADNHLQESMDKFKEQAFQAVCIAWNAGYFTAQSEALGITNIPANFTAISNIYKAVFLDPITTKDTLPKGKTNFLVDGLRVVYFTNQAPIWNLDLPGSGDTNRAEHTP